jgi:2,5-diketo-D-gluconate reductase A
LPASARGSRTTSSIAKLSEGSLFPLASFGLQIYNDDMAYRLTMTALECGYRNFFASVLAGNQKGFAKAIRDSGMDRSKLFICGSVVSNRGMGFDNAYKDTTVGWNQNMQAFAQGNIDYLDQIMLDYPGPDAASIQGQWASFQTMHQQGLTKTLAVSNFNANQLDAILNPVVASGENPKYELSVKPVVNQLPYSVAYHPGTVVEDNQKRGILVQAWAPLGGSLGGRFDSRIKEACARIGSQHRDKKSWAQVALRWIVQSGASFTTQSRKQEHFQQNLNIFDFELTDEEMKELSGLAA